MLTNKLAGYSSGERTYIEDVFSANVYSNTGRSQVINNGILLSDTVLANATNTTASSQRYDSTINSYFTESWGIFGDYHAGQYLQVDFGVPVEVTEVKYRNGPGGQWAPAYVQVWKSTDGTNWTSIYDYNDNNTSNLQTISFSTHVARYWRLYQNSNTRGGSNGYEWHMSDFSMKGTLQTSTAKGGMVWIKSRTNAGSLPSGSSIPPDNHYIFDTTRTNQNVLCASSAIPQDTSFGSGYFNFLNYGFDTGSITNNNWTQKTSTNYVAWTFRKAPKFFDMVTYTGNGVAGRTINHSLGIAPGMIITKRTDGVGGWVVNDRTGTALYLNDGSASSVSNMSGGYAYCSAATGSSYTVNQYGGDMANVNANGVQYIAYLFAHDTTTDGLIQCGTFTTDSAWNATVDLGWEPQYILIKSTSYADNWSVIDNMRGWSDKTGLTYLLPNLTNAEANYSAGGGPTANGFKINTGSPNSTYIYMAIRRGPMKTPTDGTKVFATGASYNAGLHTSNFPVDLAIEKQPDGANSWRWIDRLRGASSSYGASLQESTSAESNEPYWEFDRQNGVYFNLSAGINYRGWMFRRAPGFFDIVCYTGTGAVQSVKHNLGVTPDLIIVKNRTASGADDRWRVLYRPTNSMLYLNNTNAAFTDSTWNPTSTAFNAPAAQSMNESGVKFVSYLFASCPGVSKVGAITDTGSTMNINCGFTNGARFVLIKRISGSGGDWYMFDTARGIISGSGDPHLSLNSGAAQSTSWNPIDPYSSGFTLNSGQISLSGETLIYLAIA